ncbi:MAG: hypothetical protein WC812_02295 [Candidatus Pacearchaeota archaeon]|jgi:hypothetical protein
MKKLLNLLTIPIFTFGLFGCRDSSQDFENVKEYDNYKAIASFGPEGKKMFISNGKDDIFAEGDSMHKTFYLLRIYLSPESELTKYANVDSLNKIYNEVKETGEKHN